MKIQVFFIIAVLWAPFAVQAEEIIFRGPRQSDAEYLAQKIMRPEARGYDEYLAARPAPKELKDGLKNTFIKAQEGFLRNEVDQIREDWQDVATFAYKADWTNSEREMIQIAYMRLAQIAPSVDETNTLISHALYFDPEFEPNSRHFPPPLVEKFRDQKKQLRTVQLETDALAGFSIALINGKRSDIQKSRTIEIPAGTKRVTLLSPTYRSVTRVMAADELTTYSPQKEILPGAQLLVQKSAANVEVGDLSPLLERDLVTPSVEQKIPKAKEPFYKKKSFWVGTAIVGGLFAVLNEMRSEKSTDRSPTHREGF